MSLQALGSGSPGSELTAWTETPDSEFRIAPNRHVLTHLTSLQTHSHSYPFTHMNAPTLSDVLTNIPSLYTHNDTHMCAHTLAHCSLHTHTFTSIYACKHTDAHAHSHMHILLHTHAHTYLHTRKNTHSCTQIFPGGSWTPYLSMALSFGER